MKSIATVTMNPTIDVAYEVESVFHTRKMRAGGENYAPGGGGINVARVFVRLGGNARCFYLSGGPTGPALDGLVDLHQLVRVRIPISEPTRLATAVLERKSGKEYRFVPPGPTVAPGEWQQALELVGEAECDFLVASGSLPPGVPDDFYARLAERMGARGIGMVLDTSGPALSEAVAAGGLLLIKPSLGEFRQLVGKELDTPEDVAEEASAIVAQGRVEVVAVTMGHRGAVLARKDGAFHLPALDVEAKSAVGAGDSFLAAMVHGLSRGWDVVKAFRFGMAAGSAAVLTPGTNLAYPADIDRLFASVPEG